MDNNHSEFDFGASDSAKLDIVRSRFLGVEPLSWQELFAGFDTLSAITYSSGLDFLRVFLPSFKKAAITIF